MQFMEGGDEGKSSRKVRIGSYKSHKGIRSGHLAQSAGKGRRKEKVSHKKDEKVVNAKQNKDDDERKLD